MEEKKKKKVSKRVSLRKKDWMRVPYEIQGPSA